VLAQKGFIAKPEQQKQEAQKQEALGQLIVALIHNKHKRKQFDLVCQKIIRLITMPWAQ